MGPVSALASPVWPQTTAVTDDRPPIVLLHGLTFHRQMWRPPLDVLARLDPGRRAVAFDLAGHGDSPGWPANGVDRLAEGVHRAVVAAELRPPVVVGHPMSAIIATVYFTRPATPPGA